MKLLKKLEMLKITVENDMVTEVLSYVDVDENISLDEILKELDNDKLDYSGACHESIDSMIDIYYYDIRKWSVDNYDWVDQAKEDGLCEGTDFHESIQAGQYLFYSDQFYTALTEIVSEVETLIDNTSEAV